MRAPVPSAAPVLTKISVRFFRRDLVLVLPILSKISYMTRRTGKELPWIPPRQIDFIDEVGATIPEEVWEKRIEQLWNYLSSSREAGRPRLKLDFLDLSLCQLSVRALYKQVRHGHLSAPRPNYVAAGKRFLGILEKLRKRARRAAVKATGRNRYRWITEGWRRYVRDLRVNAINCRCGRALSPGAYRMSRFYLGRIVKIAEQELRRDNLPIPDPRTLREYATSLLHNVRRHREGNITARSLVESPAGRSCIRFFMRRKTRETSEKR